MSMECSLGRYDVVMIDKTIRVFERLDEVLRAIPVGGPRKISEWHPDRPDAPRQHDHLMRLDLNAAEVVEEPFDLGPCVDPDRSILLWQTMVPNIGETFG